MSSRTATFVHANSFHDEAYLRNEMSYITNPTISIQDLRIIYSRPHWIYHRQFNPELFDDVVSNRPNQDSIHVFWPYDEYLVALRRIQEGSTVNLLIDLSRN